MLIMLAKQSALANQRALFFKKKDFAEIIVVLVLSVIYGIEKIILRVVFVDYFSRIWKMRKILQSTWLSM